MKVSVPPPIPCSKEPTRDPEVCPRCAAHVGFNGSCAGCLLSIATSRPQPPNLHGEVFGSYVLGRVLGQGGMGVVYEALDMRLGRTVALKILADDIDTSDQLRREAALAASLEHDHIVPVYEADEHGGIAYFTMKRIDGGSLTTPVASERRAAEIALAIAKAVDFAHRRGILHLDLKPGNVLVDKEGRPFVTDFGLATRDALSAGATLMSGGTPLYMAPEAWRGDPGAASTAADVWGAGAILYEMLTGRPPFQASSRDELMQRVLWEKPPPLVGVSVDLAAVCLRCLEKDPADRYATAGELAADITRFLDGEPVGARPRVRRAYLIARHPLFFVFALVLVCAVGFAISSCNALKSTEQTAYDAADAAAISFANLTAMQIGGHSAAMERSSRDARVIAALSARGALSASDVCNLLLEEYHWESAAWFMLDADGNLKGRAPLIADDGKRRNFTFRDYHKGVLDLDRKGIHKAYVSRAYRSEYDGDFKIAIASAVYDEASRRIGILVATFPTGAIFGGITPPGASDSDLSVAILAPRDPGDAANGPRSSSFEGRPEMVFLLRRKLERGAEVPVEIDPGDASRKRSEFTRVEPIEGTPFSVLVRVTRGAKPQLVRELRLL